MSSWFRSSTGLVTYSPNLEGNLPPNPDSDEWWMVPAGVHCPLLEELEDTATSLAVAEHYVEVAVTQEAFEHLKHLLEVMNLVTTTGNPAPKLTTLPKGSFYASGERMPITFFGLARCHISRHLNFEQLYGIWVRMWVDKLAITPTAAYNTTATTTD